MPDKVKLYRDDSLPTSPTPADDGVWYIKNGDRYKQYQIKEGVVLGTDEAAELSKKADLTYIDNIETLEYQQEHPYDGSQTFPLNYEAIEIDCVKVNGVELSKEQYVHTYKQIEILDQLETDDYVQLDYTISLVNDQVYGIIIDQTTAAPEVERVGNMALHASLPIQSKMRRCLVDDDFSVNYYCHEDDTSLKEDGTTPAVLDGTDGQVMVEIPVHWRRFTQIKPDVWRADFSEMPFPGAHEVKSVKRNGPLFCGAYKASLDRANSKLSSVCNLTADFRGGNNQAAWDAENEYKSQLGKPVTQQNRMDFDNLAGNRGEGWKPADYNVRSVVSWLMLLEYATRFHQQPMDATLTPEGFKKGGLGSGPTDVNGAAWLDFNSRYPLFRCGLTNSLGNKTGEIPVTLQDFPAAGQTFNTQVFSYRGIENFYGDLWEWMTGVNFDNDNYIGYVRMGSEDRNSDYQGYRPVAIAQSAGYISKMAIGKYGDLLPAETSASSSTYWTDYHWKNAGFRGLIGSGAANYGVLAGSFCAHSNAGVSHSTPHIGSRLCGI